MKFFNITFMPDGGKISIHAGATILEAAGQAGIILNSVCGGKGTCGKCAVNIEADGQNVLACQYHIQSDLTVTIPVASRFFEQKILTEGIAAQARARPDIYRRYEKTAAGGKILGLAVDIGTTTIVAKLIALTTGQCLATQAAINPQTKHGDDCISRIAYAQTDEKLAELHKLVIDRINKLTARLCCQAHIDANSIYEMSIVGNTTMNHIFLKLPIAQLGRAPYRAFSVEAEDLFGKELGLRMNPAGNIHAVANIAGFVGADTTAVALAVALDLAEELTLTVDIGTNGEIILGTTENLYAASCAAGPAFEGARINCGSRAAAGAIEAILVNDDDIALDVIGGGHARSICGSGLIDATAVLLNLGIIDPTGRFASPAALQAKLPPAIISRMVEHGGQPAFVLHRAANVSERNLLLTQEDIRQVQLAKAAIRAGIKILQKKIGAKDADIKHIFLAGAFGNYIRRESALRMGLLPAVPPERIHFVGNAAASGAQMVLLSNRYRQSAKDLARKIKYVEIANQPDFQTTFADCMSF